jgi:predicted SAM-dependent methyltransferase
MKLDWKDYDKYKTESFDIVIGAELVWQGGCVEELVKIIKNLISPTGKAIIAMPKNRSMTDQFLKLINDNGMKYEGRIIDDQDLFFNPLENEKESKKVFEDLKTSNVMLYQISK